MKKLIIAFAFIALFGFSSHSYAATCGNPSLNAPAHDVFDGTSTTTVAAIDNVVCGGGNPLINSQAWGLSGADTKVVSPGATMTDEGGLTYTCNARVDVQGCSDLTGTAWYHNYMITLARQLISSGLSGMFPVFNGWFALAK